MDGAMNTKYLAIFLVVLVVGAEANYVTNQIQGLRFLKNHMPMQMLRGTLSAVQYELLLSFLRGRLKWDGFGLSAEVNDYVDKAIDMLVPFIRAYGLDPMMLPNINETFEVRPFLITYSGCLRLHDGYMTGLENVSRSGDQMVYFYGKMVRLRLQLQFSDLEFVYKYVVKVMNIGPTGGIVGTLDRFVVNIDLLFDFNNDNIQLDEFSLTDVGRPRVRFTGNDLTDWLVNPVISVFVSIFDTIVIKAVEYNIRSAVQDVISYINSHVRSIIDVIE